MYFDRRAKINYYDCDVNNTLKLSAAMRYMQQTSSEHLEHLNIPTIKLAEENMVFLLTKMCIKIHRMPVCTQDVMVGTAAITTRGVRFVREFVIESMEGERMVSALSLWILADPRDHKVLRPAKFPYPLPFHETVLRDAVGDIPIPKELEGNKGRRTNIHIAYSHLDVNRHVNNCVYGDFICDVLPYDQLISCGLDTVALSFQNEAKWGEVLEIQTTETGQGEYLIKGSHNGGPCFESYALLAGSRRLEP